jgi:hypothetical protein
MGMEGAGWTMDDGRWLDGWMALNIGVQSKEVNCFLVVGYDAAVHRTNNQQVPGRSPVQAASARNHRAEESFELRGQVVSMNHELSLSHRPIRIAIPDQESIAFRTGI